MFFVRLVNSQKTILKNPFSSAFCLGNLCHPRPIQSEYNNFNFFNHEKVHFEYCSRRLGTAKF